VTLTAPLELTNSVATQGGGPYLAATRLLRRCLVSFPHMGDTGADAHTHRQILGADSECAHKGASQRRRAARPTLTPQWA
jgi:hypothetical protein